ncbi:MAG: metallophosphoesterase [Methanocellales archaeon]|nr:metallophosphoesterase [Methanocellales archaeon]MDD4898536.1 metallophosphoesterase [Methanocellales archaeon]
MNKHHIKIDKYLKWKRAILIGILLLPLILFIPLATAATTDVHILKYAIDGSLLNETTLNYTLMEANLPIYGDGFAHYYHQGPIFDENDMWNPSEDLNIETRDYGAVRGTDIKDLCELVGGMSPGDEIKIKAEDGFYKRFDYTDVYEPQPRQGPLVLTWWRADEGYPPAYYTGMRLVFFADSSTNPWSWHVFGNWDMHECLSPQYWHNYSGIWPATSGLSVCQVDELAIYSTLEPAELSSIEVSPTDVTLNIWDTQQFTATAYDQYGNEMPNIDFAWYSSNETVGTVNCFGLFDANVAGTTTVTALNGTVNGTATIAIIPPLTVLWGPYITCTSTNSTTINWKTENATTGTVKYAIEEYHIEHGDYSHTIADTENKQLHHLSITNLTPNTKYWYQLSIENQSTEQHSFRTFPTNESFSFVVYGDTRAQTGLFTQIERHKLVADRIAEEENISFVLHTGDLVTFGSYLEEWNGFFDAGEAMLANTTIYPVLGNHEDNHTNYYDAFGVPEWYSFNCGNTHFTFLDSNDWASPYMTEQTNWLRNDLNISATWKFVSFHHPLYSSDELHWGGWKNDLWEDIYINNSVSAVFNGHVHVYERYEENGIQYFVLGCGGAPSYNLAEEKILGYQNSLEHTLGYAKFTIEADKERATVDFIKVADVSEDNKNVTYVYPPDTIFETVILYPPSSPRKFDTGISENPYPSISGTHQGMIIPSDNITVQRAYIHPCPGTGGHIKYIQIENSSWNITANCTDYQGDWPNASFDEPFTLKAGEAYNYTIITGSYPQIIHELDYTTLYGDFINCTSFVDANGKRYTDWIPAIRLLS